MQYDSPIGGLTGLCLHWKSYIPYFFQRLLAIAIDVDPADDTSPWLGNKLGFCGLNCDSSLIQGVP